MRLLTRQGYLIRRAGHDHPGHRFGSRASTPARGGLHLPHRARAWPGQKVLSLQTVLTQKPPPTPVRCAIFSLPVEVCCVAQQRSHFLQFAACIQVPQCLLMLSCCFVEER